MPGTHITIRGLTKYYTGAPLYENFDLDIPKGKIISVFGPNGCGKSTLINMIAGLVPIDGGRNPVRRQAPAATPRSATSSRTTATRCSRGCARSTTSPIRWCSRDAARQTIDRRVDELVASFDIKFDLNRYPYELSGGQQQTASIMRAIAPRPGGHFPRRTVLGARLRDDAVHPREAAGGVPADPDTTMMLVSHDLEEAVYLADQVLLLTRRPTRIAEIVRFDEPRPRTIDTVSDPDFRRDQAALPGDLPARGPALIRAHRRDHSSDEQTRGTTMDVMVKPEGRYIDADPYPWPWNGDLRRQTRR